MKALFVDRWRFNNILLRAQKEESWRESFHCLRENISHHEQNVGRNINVKVYLAGMRTILEIGGMVILIIKRQRTCLNRIDVLVFCVR